MDVVTIYLNDTGPRIVRRLSSQAGSFDVVEGMSFMLRVRSLWGAALVVDAVMDFDVDLDEVSYQPAAGDFSAEGVYRAWIAVDFGAGNVQTTDEFQINVFAHAPGQGTAVGAVYRAARALEIIAWDSLRSYPDYGDLELQRLIELAKLRVLGVAVPAADEASLDPRIVDFIAKKVLADNVLSSAISFWSDQVVQQTARGNTDEIKTFPDRIKAATEAILRYRGDLLRQAVEVDEILGSGGSVYDAPALNDVGQLLTPGLDEFPALPISVPYRGWTTR